MDQEDNGRSVANMIPFYNFSELLQKLENSSGKEKGILVNKYFDHYRKQYKRKHGTLNPESANVNDSIFCLARILLPTEDKKRTAYGLKGAKLAAIYAKVLGLDKTSEDGKRLLEFKDPTSLGNKAGNLGEILLKILESRAAHVSHNGPTIGELHSILDQMSKTPDDARRIDKQTKILQNFIRRLSPIEGKWFTRIVCKSLYLGLTTSRIFKCIHEKAEELYLRIGNLEKVCIRCNDPDVEIDFTTIEIFEPFKPMLCARLNVINEKSEPNAKKSETTGLPQPPFLLEIKWDGERFQIHYDSSKPLDDQFRYFSRNSFDFTSSFAENLTPRLRTRIKSSCKSFILDGEMMSYKKSTGGFTQQGREVEVRKLKVDDPVHCPAFIVYDIVYLNGESLTEAPLHERMRILKDQKLAVEPNEGTLHFSEQRTIQAKEQVMEALNDAVESLEEGLVVKELDSKYLVGQRESCWLKIKPEFFADTSVDDLDMIILGGYVMDGQERRTQKAIINHFVVGILDDSSKRKDKFLPVTTVGAGRLKNPDLEKLVDELLPHFVRKEIPGAVQFNGIKKPNFYIDPKKSVVVQIKATEFIHSGRLVAQFTLRFPRISVVRRDKSWSDIMTLKEFHELQASCRGKLAKRNENVGSSSGKPSKPSKYSVRRATNDTNKKQDDRRSPSRTPSPPRRELRQKDSVKKSEVEPQPGCSYKFIPSGSKGFSIPTNYKSNFGSKFVHHISPSKIVENIFDCKVFLVLGYQEFADRVKKEIQEHGGIVVENATKDLFAIVAEKISTRADKFIKDGVQDVLKYSWLEKCLTAKSFQPILPDDCWGMGKETRDQIAKDYDVYGDPYKEKSTCNSVKTLLNNIITKDDEEEQKQIAREKLKRKNNKFESDSDVECDDALIKENNSNVLTHKPEFDLDRIKHLWEEEEFDVEDCRKLKKYSFLSGCKIAFRGEMDYLLKSKIEFYAGQVSTDENENGVTHILVMDEVMSKDNSSVIGHKTAIVVKVKWILDCLENKKLIDEIFYMLA